MSMEKHLTKVLLVILMSIFFVFGQTVHAKKIGKDYRHKNTKTLEDPVKTKNGYISGTMFGDVKHPVKVYRGIPYAAPPVGDLRWKAPQPVANWTGIRESTQFSDTAGQLGDAFASLPQSEDCLYLNVITPARQEHEKLPVMVWFHGGGYSTGSGNDPLFNNYRLPENGVIVVSVNTRLDIIGLFAHPDLRMESDADVSGNYMFLDMVAALEWVQKNIEAFGGNPDNVTIFGESGGSAKVINLMASPLANGLIDKAIGQSGASGGTPLAEIESRGQMFLDFIGVSSIEQARALPWKELLLLSADFQQAYPTPGMGGVWDAAIDGYFLNDSPLEVFKAGKQNAIPFIMGANLGELTSPGIITMPQVIPYYVDLFSGAALAGVNAFAYIFDQVPVNWKEKGGVSVHAIELLYVFGDYDNSTPYSWPLIWALETYYGIGPEDFLPELTAVDRMVSEKTMAMWAQFAKKGNPGIKGSTYWPTWRPGADKYLYIGEEVRVQSGFSQIGQ